MSSVTFPKLDKPRAIEFRGKTDFVVAMMRIFGCIDRIGSWIEPGSHLIDPDDEDLIKDLLDGDNITYSTRPEYVYSALYRVDETSSK